MPALATRNGPAKSCSHRDRGIETRAGKEEERRKGDVLARGEEEERRRRAFLRALRYVPTRSSFRDLHLG